MLTVLRYIHVILVLLNVYIQYNPYNIHHICPLCGDMSMLYCYYLGINVIQAYFQICRDGPEAIVIFFQWTWHQKDHMKTVPKTKQYTANCELCTHFLMPCTFINVW